MQTPTGLICRDVLNSITAISNLKDEFPRSLLPGSKDKKHEVGISRIDFKVWATLRATSKELRAIVDEQVGWKTLDKEAVEWVIRFCLESGIKESALYLSSVTGSHVIPSKSGERMNSKLRHGSFLPYIISLKGEALEYTWRCILEQVHLKRVREENFLTNFSLVCSNKKFKEEVRNTTMWRDSINEINQNSEPEFFRHPYFDSASPQRCDATALKEWFSVPGRTFGAYPIFDLDDECFAVLLSALVQEKIGFRQFITFVGSNWTKERVSQVESSKTLEQEELLTMLLHGQDKQTFWIHLSKWKMEHRYSEMNHAMEREVKINLYFLDTKFARSYFTPRQIFGYKASPNWMGSMKGLEEMGEEEVWEFVADTATIGSRIMKKILSRFDPSKDGQFQFYKAIKRNHVSLVCHLLNDPRIDASAQDQRALIEAVGYQRTKIVQILLCDRRVDPSAYPGLLVKCIQLGDIELLNLLLRDDRIDVSEDNHRAFIEAVAQFKWTNPEDTVKYSEAMEIVEILLQHPKISMDIDLRIKAAKEIKLCKLKTVLLSFSTEARLEKALRDENQILIQMYMNELGMTEPSLPSLSLQDQLDIALADGDQKWANALIDQMASEERHPSFDAYESSSFGTLNNFNE
eukprot:TRINITY_DN2952_c0_g1_i1.p1 TRINITY_DN2952_c0_g1~~TRINITY_DN2952_c0_g1_i1.p1  ORF type:complete len:634 (+),score=146.36 TRINITY_DN2952_c0_g1_i1:46-1947(+)